MYVFNTESIGREYTPISQVTGVSSSVNNYMIQDEITNTCKNQAISNMCMEASRYGADAIMNTRFQVSITNRVTVFVYGTAVKFNT